MELILLNLSNGQTFTKYFNSPYLAEQFKKKIKYSNKLRLVGEMRV